MANCRECATPDLEQLVEWDNYPMTSVSVARKDSPPVPTGRLVLGMCLRCGFIQLIEPDPDTITYGEEYTSSSYIKPAGEDDIKLKRLMDVIRGQGDRGSKVLEIGCYDGSLMSELALQFGYDVYGCDPSGPAQELAKWNNKVVPALFNPDSYIGHKFDMVVFRNVLEHMPNPFLFLLQVARVLKPMGRIVLEIPDGEFRVCNSILGSIVPQHAFYYGESTLRKLLYRAGFGDVKLQCYRGGLIARATLGGKQRQQLDNLRMARYAEAVYTCALAGTRWNILKGNEVREKLKYRGDIWLFGANTCSTELLVTGAVSKDRVVGVIDDDSLKWGRVMVNTSINVFPRVAVQGIKDSTVVICSYFSHGELYKYLKSALGRGNKILRLYPNIGLRRV